jgi:hypothetical protein
MHLDGFLHPPLPPPQVVEDMRSVYVVHSMTAPPPYQVKPPFFLNPKPSTLNQVKPPFFLNPKLQTLNQVKPPFFLNPKT